MAKTAYSPEVEKLIKIYEKAEEDIINSIVYKRSRGYVEVADEAALERVREILSDLIGQSYQVVPKIAEVQLLRGKAAALGLASARSLTLSDYAIVERLVGQLMGELIEGIANVNTLVNNTWQQSVILGRQMPDSLRIGALEAVATGEASGYGISQARQIFIEKMKNEGITAFVDKKNKHWSLRSYASMAIRTTSRQAANLGTLTAVEDHDLYLMSSHATSCPICAPLEGRVYSKSGASPYYPPLASAFGKVDKNGPNTLDNSWLNIHPNCLHVLTEWTEQGKGQNEIRRVREFSSFKSNPPDINPQPMQQIKSYRAKQVAHQKLLNDYRQFERYRIVLGSSMPKTFQTFQKHKLANSEKYQTWMKLYRQRNREVKKLSV